MNKKIKKILFIIIPLFVGLVLFWVYFKNFNENQLHNILYNFKSANYYWILLSLVFAALSHLSRAYRWQYLLKPLGYRPKLVNSVFSIFIAYFFNLIIPRSGEVVRATTISKYDSIAFEKAFGTIVAERVFDLIMLFIIIVIAFFMQANLIESYLFKENFNPLYKIVYLSIALVLGYLFYRIIKKSNHHFAIKIKNFIEGLKEGVFSILKMENKWIFIAHTVFIWAMYLLMFYVASFALPETSNLSFSAVIIGFVAGTFAMIFFPGGFGGYPVFVSEALILYGINAAFGMSFGLLMWTSQTIMVLFFGGLSFLVLPIYNRNR